jgi:hypothetical protein
VVLFGGWFGGLPERELPAVADLYFLEEVFVLFGDLLIVQILALVAQQVHLLLGFVGLHRLLSPHVLDSLLQHFVLNGLPHRKKLRVPNPALLPQTILDILLTGLAPRPAGHHPLGLLRLTALDLFLGCSGVRGSPGEAPGPLEDLYPKKQDILAELPD